MPDKTWQKACKNRLKFSIFVTLNHYDLKVNKVKLLLQGICNGITTRL